MQKVSRDEHWDLSSSMSKAGKHKTTKATWKTTKAAASPDLASTLGTNITRTSSCSTRTIYSN